MNRYLQTWIRTTIRRSTKNAKVDVEPKLCARDLRHDGRKGNQLKKENAIQTSIGYYKVISKCKGHECNFIWAASRAYK
jgi:hypothetical protein